MIENIQDETLAKFDLREHERLKDERAPWESTWREIDEMFPDGAGGFNQGTPGAIRGQRLFDPTHIIANERFAAAGVAITTPEEKQYIMPRFLDDELMKEREVQVWCEKAGKRLYGIRHARQTGFITAAHEDWDQLGRYGTSPIWTEGRPDRGMLYRTLHLSTVFIDVDYAGLVNHVHRYMCKPVCELADMFGRDALTPKMQECLADEKKLQTPFEVIHVVRPNSDYLPGAMDGRRLPIASRYLAVDEKLYLRRGGFNSMPIAVSRNTTSPGEKYGRSAAIKMLPTISGLQAMRHTTLRAAHKAVDPALLFSDDNGATSLVTRPGGLNPGFVDDMGRPLVARMPGGEMGLPYAENETERERAVVKSAFLEDFYKILTDPNSRMTTTEVLEVMAKQGVLARPFASRYATEKQHPMSQRELELALEYEQIEPFPEVVKEAGAWPLIEYENELAAMARAQSTSKTLRFVEYSTQVSALAQTPIADELDIPAMLRGGAEEIGVRPSYLKDPEVAAADRARREEQQQALVDAEALGGVAGAALDLTKANQIAAAA